MVLFSDSRTQGLLRSSHRQWKRREHGEDMLASREHLLSSTHTCYPSMLGLRARPIPIGDWKRLEPSPGSRFSAKSPCDIPSPSHHVWPQSTGTRQSQTWADCALLSDNHQSLWQQCGWHLPTCMFPVAVPCILLSCFEEKFKENDSHLLKYLCVRHCAEWFPYNSDNACSLGVTTNVVSVC